MGYMGSYSLMQSEYAKAKIAQWRAKYKALGLPDWQVSRIILKRVWRGDLR